jgi:four helix bundle protein
MTIRKFEDLDVWKNVRELCKKIREIINETALQKEYALKDQILRSSGFVMDNISEGFERNGNKGFTQFLYISKGSLGKTRSQVYRCFDSGYLYELKYTELITDCQNLSGQISNLITYLHKSEILGLKKKSI